jgi:hypothetical protein
LIDLYPRWPALPKCLPSSRVMPRFMSLRLVA